VSARQENLFVASLPQSIGQRVATTGLANFFVRFENGFPVALIRVRAPTHPIGGQQPHAHPDVFGRSRVAGALEYGHHDVDPCGKMVGSGRNYVAFLSSPLTSVWGVGPRVQVNRAGFAGGRFV
jgi:hypothetical protein